jgi:hypothetical protein
VPFDGKPLRDLLIEAIRYGERAEVRTRLTQVVAQAFDRTQLQDLLEERALAHDAMDSSRVQRVRAEMERTDALRLQPHYIESFCLEAFERLGGSIRQREPRRYEVTHVPAPVRHRDRLIGLGEPVLPRYERIVFEKALIAPQGQPLAAFVCPGHPLLDAVIDLTLERHRDLLRQFAGWAPVNPQARAVKALFQKTWRSAQGLAEDVRFYGQWMRDEAEKRIGHLYPKVEVTAEMAEERPDLKPLVGRKLTVIAWLWARTVKSPNPAFAGVDVPLASTFMLSTKMGKEANVEPLIEPPSPSGRGAGGEGGYRFTVKVGKPKDAEVAKNGTKLARGANFQCLMSGTPIAGDYIKAEAKAGRMSARMIAIVTQGARGRVYLPPTQEAEEIARKAQAEWKPDASLPDDPRNFWTVQYGLTTYGDLFTARQLVALTTFSDMVGEAMERIRRDAIATGLPDAGKPLATGGTGATAYADAVAGYLALAVDRSADFWSTIATWSPQPKNEIVGHTFGRQAIPMTWDFGEINVFSESGGNFLGNLTYCAKAIDKLPGCSIGLADQADAHN